MKWLTFFKERTPLTSYSLIAMGPALTGYFLVNPGKMSSLVIAFLGFLFFLIELRMMDEFKDYDKDIQAHPLRPLPRGLIALSHFHRGISYGLVSLILFDLFLLLSGRHWPFFLYSLVIIHLWLMYKEFYVAKWLNARPLFYAVSHQLILVSLCLFCLSIFRDDDSLHFSLLDWVYSLSVLFSFFCYEICRKLDPNAHVVLKTYRFVYGMKGVFFLVCSLVGLHLIALAFLFQTHYEKYLFTLPLFLLIGCLAALCRERIKFKTVEFVATLNLLIFLYFGIFYVITNRTL